MLLVLVLVLVMTLCTQLYISHPCTHIASTCRATLGQAAAHLMDRVVAAELHVLQATEHGRLGCIGHGARAIHNCCCWRRQRPTRSLGRGLQVSHALYQQAATVVHAPSQKHASHRLSVVVQSGAHCT
jgi:hypothetical protein